MSAAPYEALADLAERELALVCAYDPERIDELERIAAEREALLAALPATAPAAARPGLTRALAAQQRTTAALATLAGEARRALADVDRGRRTARGYGAPGVAPRAIDRAG